MNTALYRKVVRWLIAQARDEDDAPAKAVLQQSIEGLIGYHQMRAARCGRLSLEERINAKIQGVAEELRK